jgi:two-component system, OmpR family, response regulator MprA
VAVRILLVDDDAALLESLQLVLGAEGHTATTRSAGKLALALLERERFDAIVCDVNMPDLDGFSLCRQLRARGDATPLILLTSRDG